MNDLLRIASWSWNPWAVLPFASFLACLGMAILTTPRRRKALNFTPVVTSVGIGNLCVALVMCCVSPRGGMWLARLGASAFLAMTASAFWFTTSLVRISGRPLWRALITLLAVLAIGLVWLDPLVFVSVYRPSWGGSYPRGGTHWFLPIFAPCIAHLASGTISLKRAMRLPVSRRQRQIAYVFVSYMVASLGVVDLAAVMGYDIFPVSWATSLLSGLIVYYAVVRWRLMDIRTAVHRTIIGALATLFTFIPLYVLSALTAGWMGWRDIVSRAIFVVAILFLLRMYAVRMESIIAALVARKERRLRAIVERFSEEALTVNGDELVRHLGKAISDGVAMELVSVALAIDTGDGVPLEYAILPEGEPRPPFPPGIALPREPCARTEVDPEVFAQGEDSLTSAAKSDDVVVTRWLRRYAADVLIPLRASGILIGAVVVRSVGSNVSLDETKRQFLARIAARAAVALTNAKLLTDLEEKSARLEQTVKDRTRSLAKTIEELKAAQASLVQAERQSSLALLVAGVSHEINNALNFIYGNLPTLKKYVDVYEELVKAASQIGVALGGELAKKHSWAKEAMSEAIDSVGVAAARARSIVDDLRKFARHDEGERRRADIREGIDSTLNLLLAHLGGRITVAKCYEEGIPPIECYPAALNHVFLNLLLNATQAIEKDGEIQIWVRKLTGGVSVTIVDNGSGIAEEERERVFEPFVTTRKRAAGLGLTVSRQIIARHGGQIRVTDRPKSKGTTVTVELPAVACGEG